MTRLDYILWNNIDSLNDICESDSTSEPCS